MSLEINVIEGRMSIGRAANSVADYFLENEMFKLITLVLTVLSIAFAIISAIIGPFGFLLALVAPILAEIIVNGIGQTVDVVCWLVDSIRKKASDFIRCCILPMLKKRSGVSDCHRDHSSFW
jgi:hypothetical protein